MSIFDKFNNQGLDDNVAFEELCCQLFETWGTQTMEYDGGWDYLDIRGDGGDGGVEAYWRNKDDDSYVGIQAKWFRKTITKAQYRQIRTSIDTAVQLRPSIVEYIVCIPHNLTSLRNCGNETVTDGEEGAWRAFSAKVKQVYPALKLTLWDEHHIVNLLQSPANEGRFRFWFEKSVINPDTVRLAVDKAIESLKDRYVPEITDDGGMTVFLDNFFGTTESRLRIINDIDLCIDTCRDLAYASDSLTKVKGELIDGLRESAIKCHDAMIAYADALDAWRCVVTTESQNLVQIDDIAVDYDAIEGFGFKLQELKRAYKFSGHVDELLTLLDKFRELPGEYGICRTMRDAFSFPHCLVIGEQGTGKTCGFAYEASFYLGQVIHLPILVRASEINEHDGWKDIIGNTLGLDDWTETALWQALSASAAMHDARKEGITVRSKIAVLIDGLDERPPVSRWTTLIRQGDAITKEYPRIRFAYSTRPSGIESESSGSLRECVYFVDDDGDVSTQELFDRYIEHYAIDLDGNTRYKWVLRTPMELRMFCTAYSGRRLHKEVSIYLTALVDAEVKRLDEEYVARIVKSTEMHATPVRNTLITLAEAFLQDDKPSRDRVTMGNLIERAGIHHEAIGGMLDFLESYGVLATVRHPGPISLSPAVIVYQPGSRHLWDYFMAVLLAEMEDGTAAGILLRHVDAAFMYAILLVEKRSILPLASDALVATLGVDRVRKLTIAALASSKNSAAGKFRKWALEEMARSRESLFDIVNGIVVQVADERNHPLGPTMLDEYMRTFSTPIERDIVWSIPRNMDDSYRISMYHERDAIRRLPHLRRDDKWDQMPLLLAWCLTTVSNLRRSHCRNELVRWALLNPGEYAELFDHFNNCDDPQVREDIFAIAAEIVCQGNADKNTKKRFASICLDSVFNSTDKPGNRDVALRHYGRMLVERCCTDGVVDSSEINRCRPPYRAEGKTGALPIYAVAASANRKGGYETIHYDLARYALVDKLERSFGITYFHSNDRDNEELLGLIRQSADMVGIDAPSFDGWVISAAYQYLVDHGYDSNVLAGPIGENGHRLGGVDRKISSAFDSADHGAQSSVMTVAEKYVWCARNEICGFMADRVPVCSAPWEKNTNHETDKLAHDYSSLLSYQSPLFEATVNRLSAERAGIIPSFPAIFSCDDGAVLCSEQELSSWIYSGSADAMAALLNHVPNVALSLEGDVIPVAIYASDWGFCGKQARGWAYCGAMVSSELEKLIETGTVAFDGYDHASAFATGIDVEATYISPVEYMSAVWIKEYDEIQERAKIADVHVAATPLSGSGVDSLTDIGDCWFRLPSKLAMELCEVTRTDGAHYYNSINEMVFEDVDYGEPYRRQYQALLADKNKLLKALKERDLHPVWYATLQRGGNSLANERFPQLEARSEVSWLIWVGVDGEYHSCRITDEYPVPEHIYESTNLVKELLEKYTSGNDDDGELISD